jgi:xylulose-5-phosphate/fructose-6-phosphate phosphoketolase
MTKATAITCLFLDIGGVLLTDGWDHHARKRAATHFKLEWAEMEDRHHLTFDTYEDGKLTLGEYLGRVVFYQKRAFKGWTGPKTVDGLQIEGTFRAHQVPLLVDSAHPRQVKQLESWMKSYKAEDLFDKNGRLMPELAELAPKGNRRMGANPHANGGILLRDLHMPDFHVHAVKVPSPGAVDGQDTLVLGKFLRDVVRLNQDQRNFRVFGPDETLSNLLGAVFEVTNRQWDAREVKTDEFLAPAGRVLDSTLSEHQCEGWLEGYLLTGRHGLFNSYEAFIRIVDSMFSQHAKWLKVTLELPWRRKIASLNHLLASHVWQQDHDGFTHQDPGFLDHVINKKADTRKRAPSRRLSTSGCRMTWTGSTWCKTWWITCRTWAPRAPT